MGLPDETFSQLEAALYAWDMSPAFPAGYTGSKSIMTTDGWPYDVIDNMLSEGATGFMTKPIVSLYLADAPEEYRTLGEVYSKPSANVTRFGRRVQVTYIVTAWADQQLGGMDMAKKIAGQVQGCFFVNRISLSALRPLTMSGFRNSYEDRPQLWRCDGTLRGYTVISYDA